MVTALKVGFGLDPQAPSFIDIKEGVRKYNSFYWPSSDQKRREILSVKRNSLQDFESVYQGRPGSREGSVFLEDDFCHYDAPDDLELGIYSPKLKEFMLKTKAHGIIQAWDTAFEETKQSAYTVCVTGLLVPCNVYHRHEDPAVLGVCDQHFDIYILEVYREKKDFADVVMSIRSQFIKWSPEKVIIENKASGISAIQVLQKTDLPIYPVPAEQSKRARAINGVGAGSAQGWFRRHRVIFPRQASWLEKYTTELKDFSGAQDAISDQVDATVHLVRYAIIAGAATTLLPSDWTPERGTPTDLAEMLGLGPNSQQQHFGNHDGMFLTNLGDLPNMSVDPFYGLCGRCDNYINGSYCKVHRAKKAAMDTCIMYSDRVGS